MRQDLGSFISGISAYKEVINIFMKNDWKAKIKFQNVFGFFICSGVDFDAFDYLRFMWLKYKAQ